MQPALCVPQDATLGQLYDLLKGNDISGAPVVDSRDYLVGVVSLTDVATHSQKGQKKPTRVRDIMTQRAYTVSDQDDLLEAIELMLSEEIHRVIVTHRDHVVGIVTTTDVLQVYCEELRKQR